MSNNKSNVNRNKMTNTSIDSSIEDILCVLDTDTTTNDDDNDNYTNDDNEDTDNENDSILSSTSSSSSAISISKTATPSTTLYNEFKIILSLVIPSIIAQCDWALPRGILSAYIGSYIGTNSRNSINYNSTYTESDTFSDTSNNTIYSSTVYLDSYMIVMTLCGLFTLSIIEGILDAMDTLILQSYGYKKYNVLLIIVVRGIIVLCTIILPLVVVLYYTMYPYLLVVLFQQNTIVSYLAYQWFIYYCLSIPFYCLFHVTSIFIGAQNILLPEVYSVIVSTCIILPLLLYTIAGSTTTTTTTNTTTTGSTSTSTITTDDDIDNNNTLNSNTSLIKLLSYTNFHSLNLGFEGTAISIVITSIFQLFFFWYILYKTQCINPLTLVSLFPTSTTSEGTTGTITTTILSFYKQWTLLFCQAIKYKPFKSFIILCFGGMLASSEWLYWEIISLMIGTHGVTTLAIHTIPSQIITVTYMIYLGCSIGISIRIGNLLPNYPVYAKYCTIGSLIVFYTIFASIAICTYIFRITLVSFFTTDIEVMNGCEEIWCKVSIYTFTIGVFSLNSGIATGLGKQWIVGIYTILFLFIIGIPLFYYTVILKNGTINDAWNCIIPPYIALNITVLVLLLSSNWTKISHHVQQQHDDDDKETLALLLLENEIETSNNNNKNIIKNKLVDSNNNNNTNDVETTYPINNEKLLLIGTQVMYGSTTTIHQKQ